MWRLGDTVSKPFLQDVVQFKGLGLTMLGMVASRPLLVPEILAHVGPGHVASWLGHFSCLLFYTLLSQLAAPALEALFLGSGLELPGAGATSSRPWLRLPPREALKLGLLLDAWRYGSGLDYDPESRDHVPR